MTSIFNSASRLCCLDTYCSRQQNQHAVFVDNWENGHLSVKQIYPGFCVNEAYTLNFFLITFYFTTYNYMRLNTQNI